MRDHKTNTILVLDDHYAIKSDDSYDINDFKENFGELPFNFLFSSAWDDDSKRYSVKAALKAVATFNPDGILLDVMFGNSQTDRLGLDILVELTKQFPAIPVVMMTSVVKDELWEKCAQLGAVDYMAKPMNERVLAQTLHRYVGAKMKNWLVGQNRDFLNAVDAAARAAEGQRSHTMITGETGTGKELIASYIHRHGRGSENKEFKVLFLPGFAADLQKSQMFGFCKGSFSGAQKDQAGIFSQANGGVVFLDEIGDIDPSTQIALLRVANDGEVVRMGGSHAEKVDVQILSATNANLSKRIKENEFRGDLSFRLKQAEVHLPPLAQRSDDIPLLIRHLLRCEAINRKRAVPELPVHLEGKLIRFPWEGNVRGLLSYVLRVFDFAGKTEICEKHFLSALGTFTDSTPYVEDAQPLATDIVQFREVPLQEFSLHAQPNISEKDMIQCLRLEELGVLNLALMNTQDRHSKSFSRAEAAAILRGETKCSTNVFDRWVDRVWETLSEDNRKIALTRFPNLLGSRT